jgi:hypothetical protein
VVDGWADLADVDGGVDIQIFTDIVANELVLVLLLMVSYFDPIRR